METISAVASVVAGLLLVILDLASWVTITTVRSVATDDGVRSASRRGAACYQEQASWFMARVKVRSAAGGRPEPVTPDAWGDFMAAFEEPGTQGNGCITYQNHPLGRVGFMRLQEPCRVSVSDPVGAGFSTQRTAGGVL